MKRAMTAALAAAMISSVAVGVTSAGASVATKADPQKVCEAIASGPETAKEELAAIRLAQSGKNPEVTKALAAMEKAAQKAVKTKKPAPIQTDAYNEHLTTLFEFAYQGCTEVQVEATLSTSGLAGIPSAIEAGPLGIKVTNETDTDVGFGLVRVDDDNTATTDEIVQLLLSSEGEIEGVQFVGGGGSNANESGYVLADVDAGRYLFVVFGDDQDVAAGVAAFTVS